MLVRSIPRPLRPVAASGDKSWRGRERSSAPSRPAGFAGRRMSYRTRNAAGPPQGPRRPQHGASGHGCAVEPRGVVAASAVHSSPRSSHGADGRHCQDRSYRDVAVQRALGLLHRSTASRPADSAGGGWAAARHPAWKITTRAARRQAQRTRLPPDGRLDFHSWMNQDIRAVFEQLHSICKSALWPFAKQVSCHRNFNSLQRLLTQ